MVEQRKEDIDLDLDDPTVIKSEVHSMVGRPRGGRGAKGGGARQRHLPPVPTAAGTGGYYESGDYGGGGGGAEDGGMMMPSSSEKREISYEWVRLFCSD